jgi:endoglucanase
MRTKLLILVCIGMTLMLSSAQTPAQNLPKVKVEKNHFVDEKGQIIIFRGFNLSDPDKLEKSGHWNREYFAKAHEWGANLVRIPIHPAAWRNRGAKDYLSLLDEGISWAEEFGMYVIIDWHSIGNLRTGLFQSEMYNTSFHETLEFWQTISRKYADRSTVAFFELFNEPTTYNDQFGSLSWPQWKEMCEDMIAIIYAFDKSKIPLVAGFNWAYDLSPVKNDPIAYEGVAYVSHPYPMKRSKPWEPQWEKDWGFVAQKHPLILTEIGYCYKEDRGAHIPVISDNTYGPAIVEYCKSRGISWVVWVFDPDWAPMMFSDWNYTPTHQGEYFKSVLQAK